MNMQEHCHPVLVVHDRQHGLKDRTDGNNYGLVARRQIRTVETPPMKKALLNQQHNGPFASDLRASVTYLITVHLLQ